MAIPIRPSSYIPTAFVDSKAGGYVSIFTAQGWDQWRQAVESLSQVAADNQFAYEKKMKAYEAVTAAISTKREDIISKIADIRAKKADVLAKYALKNADLEQKVARDQAQVPSSRTSSSGRWSQSSSRTLWNPKYKEDGTPVAAGTPAVAVDPALLANAGAINSTAGMSAADKQTEIAAAAKASGGYSDAQAADFAQSFTADAGFVSGMPISGGQSEAGRKTGRSAGTSTSSSTGQTWKDYNASQVDLLNDPALKEYDTALADLTAQLDGKGFDISQIGVPVLEPIDLITTARQIYKDKFGDVPDSTTLRVDGEVVSVLKNLMPFEVTNGMKKSVNFFQRYIDDAIAEARKNKADRDYPNAPQGDLTVDELNRAVEYGKRRAREVLFGLGAPGGDVSGELTGKTVTVEGDPTQPIDEGQGEALPFDAPLTPPPVWPPVDPATFDNTIPSDETKTSEDKTKTSEDKTKTSEDQTAQPLSTEPSVDNSQYIPTHDGRSLYDLDQNRKYKERLKRELDALDLGKGPPPSVDSPRYRTPPVPQSTMQYMGPGVAPIPPADGRRFDGPGPNIGQKTEGVIPEGLATAPPQGGYRMSPAVVPYSLPPSGLGGPYPEYPPVNWGHGDFPGFPFTYRTPLAQGERVEFFQGEKIGDNPPIPDLPRPVYKTDPKLYKTDPDLYNTEPTPNPFKAPPDSIPRDSKGVPLDLSRIKKDPESASRQYKVDAFLAGTKTATQNPKGTAKSIMADSVGKYVATLFDENKSKGLGAKPVASITEQLIKEYSGDPAKQKKAIQRYVELSTLDANSKRIG
jgi:hypothetical protein